MAGSIGRRSGTPSAKTRRSDAREELKRTLDRNTAVQGERAEEVDEAPRPSSGSDGAPHSAHPANHKKNTP